MEIVCIIPARGGSKGIPRKNLYQIGGKPLIAHSILQAKAAPSISRVIVSTDDREIRSVSKQYGAEVIVRPEEISDDTATSESALRHALETLLEAEAYSPDLVVFLQCTSPIRTSDDIEQAIQKLANDEADSLLSVSPKHHFLWTVEEGVPVSVNYDFRARERRQDLPPQYIENGSIYIFKPEILLSTENRLGGKLSMYIMPPDAAYEIDEILDIEIVGLLLDRRRDQNQTA